MFSTLGNVSFAASILFAMTDRDYLLLNLPWLIGSAGTVVFDFIVCPCRDEPDVRYSHNSSGIKVVWVDKIGKKRLKTENITNYVLYCSIASISELYVLQRIACYFRELY